MDKKLLWKILSDDGLLKEPAIFGPYYDEESLNPSSGFDTEEQAIERLQQMKNDYDWELNDEFVLIEIYMPKKNNKAQ